MGRHDVLDERRQLGAYVRVGSITASARRRASSTEALMGGRLEKRVANILLPGEGFTSLVFGLCLP